MRSEKTQEKKRRTKRKIIIAICIFMAFAIATPIVFLKVTDISRYDIKVKDREFTYTGKEIVPEITIKNRFTDLEEGKDFAVKCRNNVEVGTAKAVITGEGIYRGKVVETYEIKQASQKIKGEDSYRRNVSAEDFPLEQSAKTPLSYKSSNKDIATVDDEGNVDPIAPGTVTISVTAEESDTYKPATKEVTVEVTETSRQQMIRKTLEWAKKIADDDRYVYGHGKCPICHKSRKEYDCMSFIIAAYWHGGGLKSMEKYCETHYYTKAIRKYMKESPNWKNCGKLSIYELKKGDVLFFYDKKRSKKNDGWYHVEMYYGDGMIVGAHSKTAGITLWDFGSYYFHFKEAYRYVGD